MRRETLQKILHVLVHAFTRLKVEGIEYVPQEGGLLVTTNHLSRLDTVLLFISGARPDITALVADKYKNYPLFRFILDTGGIIWLDRSNADFGAIRTAIKVLREGVCLGIAPEGTRAIGEQLQEGKPGAVLLAAKAGVPITPVGISGTERVFRRIFTLQRPRITVRYGPAFTLPPLDTSRRDEQMKEFTDEIMCRIAALLPEKYHGYYRAHPRLRELLARNPTDPSDAPPMRRQAKVGKQRADSARG